MLFFSSVGGFAERAVFVPEDFFLRQIPSLAVVVVALIEKIGASVGIGEDAGMA